MAKFLYNIGSFAARKAWAVIVIWVILLAAAGGSYAAFGGTLVNSFTLPGSETQRLSDELSQKYPDANHGTGQVVISTSDGSAITDEQKQAFSDALASATDIDGVASVRDPFQTEQQKTDSEKQLADAKSQIDSAPQQFKDAQTQIDDAQQQIDDNQAKLDAAPQQIDDAQQQIDEGNAQIADAENQINDAIAQADDGQKQVDDGRAQVADAQNQINDAQAQLDAAREQAQTAGVLETQQATLDSQQSEIDAQQEQLNQKIAELDAAQQQVTDARNEIASNQQALQEKKDQAAEAQAQVDQQKAALPDQQQQLTDAQNELNTKKQELADKENAFPQQKADYEYNQALFDLLKDYKLVSDDGSTAIGTLSFDEASQSIPQTTKDAVMEHFENADLKGLQVNFDKNIAENMTKILGVGEVIGVVIALVVLVVMLGTLVAAGLPIIMALVGVAVGVLASLAFSTMIEMNSITPVLGIMLALAVGIDYSLFILNRHRVNLSRGMEIKESIALANGTSGNAVLFAGTTVIVALLALNVTGIPFLAIMGNVAAACVAVAVLVAITLTPAVMSLIGRKALPKKAWKRIEALQTSSGDVELDNEANRAAAVRAEKPRGWIGFITKHSVTTLVVGIVALVLMAIPMGQMRLGLPDASSADADTTQYKTYSLINEKFGAGMNGAIVVVADVPDNLTDQQDKDLQIKIAQEIDEQENVQQVVPVGISDDKTIEIFQVIPTGGPTAESTENLVNNLRDLTITGDDGQTTTLGVTGQTGGNIDISQILASKLPLYLGIVLGLSFIILILVFRSILVPLMATVGFLFSVLASFGAVVAVYQWGWLGGLFGVHDPGTILSFLPTLLIGILFGLAMDYQVFLVSGMREAYVHGKDARTAIVAGYNTSVKVVVAAAIIMISVFAGFIHAELTMIRPLGFGLAVGVLIDAFVVRMTLIPAAMHLFGEKAWWMPKWLDKILPDMDVEGTSLEKH